MRVEGIQQLEELDRRFQDICSNLIVPPGTLFRLANSHLDAWGIRVTPENAEWIEERGQRSYRKEWQTTPTTSYDAIDEAIRVAGLAYDNENMNAALGSMAATALIEMAQRTDAKRKIVVLDAGSGTGKTTAAIVTALNMKNPSVLERCRFLLLEMAFERHVEAVRSTLRGTSALIEPQTGEFHQFFEERAQETIDLVVSNAVLHHMTSTRYIDLIHSRLRDDGLIVFGDWYTAIWSQPSFFVDIMRDLGATPQQILAFRQEFNVDDWTLGIDESELTEEERTTNGQMRGFVRCLAAEMQRIPTEERLMLLEGHEGFGSRERKFRDHGFLTSQDELAAKYRAFVGGNVAKMYPGREFATVAAFAKKR